MKKKFYMFWRCIIANVMYMRAPVKIKEVIDADVQSYIQPGDKVYESGLLKLDCVLISGKKTFRNVFYHRVGPRRILCRLSGIFLPAVREAEIYGEFGGGLYLSHNYTVVHTARAGKNLHIGPGVVVGKNKGQYPNIGDNVVIEANSTVIGGINIGDNTVIKAGSVVTKSLEGNAVYSGNPARLVAGRSNNCSGG